MPTVSLFACLLLPFHLGYRILEGDQGRVDRGLTRFQAVQSEHTNQTSCKVEKFINKHFAKVHKKKKKLNTFKSCQV